MLSVAFHCIQCVSRLRYWVLDSSGRVMRSKSSQMMIQDASRVKHFHFAFVVCNWSWLQALKKNSALRRLWIESRTTKRGEENYRSLIELKNGPPAETRLVNYFSAIFKFRKLAGKQWLKILTSFVWEVSLFTIETPGVSYALSAKRNFHLASLIWLCNSTVTAIVSFPISIMQFWWLSP